MKELINIDEITNFLEKNACVFEDVGILHMIFQSEYDNSILVDSKFCDVIMSQNLTFTKEKESDFMVTISTTIDGIRIVALIDKEDYKKIANKER